MILRCFIVLGIASALTVLLGEPPRAVLSAQERTSALETIRIRPNVYVVFGGGANVTVHEGEDGLVLIDTGTADRAKDVLTAVRAISHRPVRYIINTSADDDKVGGNDILARAGASLVDDTFAEEPRAAILAHENVLTRLSSASPEVPSGHWPSETFTSRYRSLYVNDEAVQVIRQVGAHTDGDVLVHLRRADVIVTGDILDLRHFPVIDPEKGGSIQGELEALNRLLELTVPAVPLPLKSARTLVVAGHGRVSDYAELVEYRDMLTIIKDIVEDMVKRGMTLEQVKAANPTAGYRKRWGRESGPWTTDMFVEAVYNGLKNPPRS